MRRWQIGRQQVNRRDGTKLQKGTRYKPPRLGFTGASSDATTTKLLRTCCTQPHLHPHTLSQHLHIVLSSVVCETATFDTVYLYVSTLSPADLIITCTLATETTRLLGRLPPATSRDREILVAARNPRDGTSQRTKTWHNRGITLRR